MTRFWSIFLYGRVPTKGSVVFHGRGKGTSDCSWLNEWTGWACAEVLASNPPTWKRHQPVSVQMQIAVERPAGHFRKSGQLSATGRFYSAPTRHVDGDWDKHERAVLDMLVTAGVLADDADVVSPGTNGRMFWADVWAPGVRITIKDVYGQEMEPIHKAVPKSNPASLPGVLCGPDGDWSLHELETRVSVHESYAVTCAKCRELMGMSKGIR